VTGLGAVTPIGADAPATWRAAVAGESGIDFIRSFDASEFPVRVAAEVKDFDPTQVAGPKEARRLDRNVLLSLGAAREAVADAGLDGAYSPDRIGILFGTAIGGIMGIVEQVDVLRDRGPDRVAPTFIPNVLVDTASGQLAIALGFRGPNYAPVSACATGSTAIGEAAEVIRRGDADAVLAGRYAAVDTADLLRAVQEAAAWGEVPQRLIEVQGVLLCGRGDWQMGLACLRRLSDPGPAARALLGEGALRKGDRYEAAALFLGAARACAPEDGRAIGYYRRYLDLKSADADAEAELAGRLEALGRAAEAAPLRAKDPARSAADPAAALAGPIWMVDPLGHLMLQFPAEADPVRVRKDVSKLVYNSRIG